MDQKNGPSKKMDKKWGIEKNGPKKMGHRKKMDQKKWGTEKNGPRKMDHRKKWTKKNGPSKKMDHLENGVPKKIDHLYTLPFFQKRPEIHRDNREELEQSEQCVGKVFV